MNKIKRWLREAKMEVANYFMIDWLEWYYYIVDIMYKNMESTNPIHQTKTKVWANTVLKQKFNLIMSQHVLCKKQMFEIYYDYLYNLDDINAKVLEKIFNNIKIKNK